MSITDITRAIRTWKAHNNGQCPTFANLCAVLVCDPEILREILADAEKIGIIYEPEAGRYEYRPDMT